MLDELERLGLHCEPSMQLVVVCEVRQAQRCSAVALLPQKSSRPCSLGTVIGRRFEYGIVSAIRNNFVAAYRHSKMQPDCDATALWWPGQVVSSDPSPLLPPPATQVCGRPSTKECYVCTLRFCDFCTRKQHWKARRNSTAAPPNDPAPPLPHRSAAQLRNAFFSHTRAGSASTGLCTTSRATWQPSSPSGSWSRSALVRNNTHSARTIALSRARTARSASPHFSQCRLRRCRLRPGHE